LPHHLERSPTPVASADRKPLTFSHRVRYPRWEMLTHGSRARDDFDRRRVASAAVASLPPGALCPTYPFPAT
jgi:hypothetical protein